MGKKGRKPWTPEISTLVRAAREAHWKWKEHGGGKDVGNVFFRNLKEAKRNLRRMQRQTAAEERNKLYHEIMDSFENDKQLFYKLFVNREIIHHRSSTLIVNGTSFDTSVAIGNAWTDYFETLSKASNSGKFDGIYKSLVETDLQNLRKLYGNSKSTVKFTTAEKVSKIFVTMKNRKAPDELSLVA